MAAAARRARQRRLAVRPRRQRSRARRDAGTGGMWCVPALYGLGTPEWTGTAAADIAGLTASSTGADIAEAALIGVAHQVSDAVDAVRSGLPKPLTTIRVDGG